MNPVINPEPVEKTTVVSCQGVATRNWYAWNNLMPPKPDDFHIVGEVQVGNPGVGAMLCPKEPQGKDPDILLLYLILIQQPGIWPPVVTWVEARYDKILLNSTYKRVEVFCADEKIADVPVVNVH